jgi:hypothetical protein
MLDMLFSKDVRYLLDIMDSYISGIVLDGKFIRILDSLVFFARLVSALLCHFVSCQV